MFRKRMIGRPHSAPRTNRSRPGSRLARRLGVESMEGRVMLSATMLEYAPLELQAAQFGLESAQGNLAGDQITSIVKISEGGFITSGVFTSASYADGSAIPSVGPSATGALDYTVTRNTIHTPSDMDTTDTWQLFDADDAAGSGIRPITFADDIGNSELQPTIDQGLTEYSGFETTANEGGSIPIQTILSRNEPSVGIKLREGALAKSALETPIESQQLNRLASIAASSTAATKHEPISGDWARAMVLEMAGGEPDDHRRPAANDQQDLPAGDDARGRRASGPLSSMELERGAEQGGAGAGADQYVDRASVRERGQLPAVDSGEVGSALMTPVDSITGEAGPVERIGTAPSSTSVVVSSSPSEVVVGGGNLSRSDAAHIAALDELGDSESSVLTTLANGALRGSFGATPLLMVLALERIAASNSRRAKQNGTSIVKSRLPQRSRDAAGHGEQA